MDDFYGNTEAERREILNDNVLDESVRFVEESSARFPLVEEPKASTEETEDGVRLTLILHYGLEQQRG